MLGGTALPRLTPASIQDGRTDLQSRIGCFPIPPQRGQLVVAPPSKAHTGSRNGCRTFLPCSWAAPLGILHPYKQALLASRQGPGLPAGLLRVTGSQNSLNKTPGRDCTRRALLFDDSPAQELPSLCG